jgi:hypothetical protein
VSILGSRLVDDHASMTADLDGSFTVIDLFCKKGSSAPKGAWLGSTKSTRSKQHAILKFWCRFKAFC